MPHGAPGGGGGGGGQRLSSNSMSSVSRVLTFAMLLHAGRNCIHGWQTAWVEYLQIGLEPPEDGALRLARILLFGGHAELAKLQMLTAIRVALTKRAAHPPPRPACSKCSLLLLRLTWSQQLTDKALHVSIAIEAQSVDCCE